ncbi:DUF554 domain-containing protein [Synechococcus elongatus]|nr:DUF554 domain-containing protein [Synechococcus elongatus]
MSWEIWSRLNGTVYNGLAVAIGGCLGVWLRDRLPDRYRQRLTQGVGLITVIVGLQMTQQLQSVRGPLDSIVVALLALTLGGLLGEFYQLESRIQRWSDRLLRQGQVGAEGFVAASLLFCVGPMTLIGSLENGLNGDPRLLLIKGTMDGLSAIALAGSYGRSILFSIGTIAISQGGMSLTAALLSQGIPDPSQLPALLLFTGTGGLLILAIAANLLGVARLPTITFLPALILAPAIDWVARSLVSLLA